MKKSKFLMPVLAFVMAVGLAFTTKADVQTAGWVERDGMPYQLQNDPCSSGTADECEVIFTDDLNTVHQVYTNSDLQTPKEGGSPDGEPYVISD